MKQTAGLCSAVALATIALLSPQPADAASASRPSVPAAGRVLHFPADRDLGALYITDERVVKPDPDKPAEHGQYLGQAKGEIVVPVGYRVRLELNETSGNNLSGLSLLRPDDLHELYLGKRAGDAGLAHLGHLTGLKELRFPASFGQGRLQPFTPRGLKALARLESLEKVVAPENMNDAGFAAIVEALPKLKRLSISNNSLTNQGLALLPRLQSLEELAIGDGRFTDAGLAHLAKLPMLHSVWLWGPDNLGERVTDDVLIHIRKIPGLKTLKLPSMMTDDCLAHLAGHPALEELNLNYCEITDEGLTHLTTLPALRKLELCESPRARANRPLITDAGAAELKKIKTLEHLLLPNFGFTDKALADLTELDNLKYLWIGGWSESPLTDEGIASLARCKALESLTVGSKGLTAKGMAALGTMSGLRHLSLSADELSEEGMAHIARLRKLENFQAGTKKLTVSGLNQLNGLEHLNRIGVHFLVNDGTTLDLGRLPRLEHLSLCGKGFTFRDEDLACLANLKQLGWLGITSSPGTSQTITDDGIAHLAGLTGLKRLNLAGSGITDRSLECLAGMSDLHTLFIQGRFTDAGLQKLQGRTAFQVVSVTSANKLSPAAIARLRSSLPNLQLFDVKENKALFAGSAPEHPRPGARAPEFTVETLDGKEFTLSKQRGKVVLLHFWGSWCRPCIAGIPQRKKTIASLERKYRDRLAVINLAMDADDLPVRDVLKTHNWSGNHARIPMLSEVASNYGVTGAPNDFLIGPDGRILLNPDSPETGADTERAIDRALNLSGK